MNRRERVVVLAWSVGDLVPVPSRDSSGGGGVRGPAPTSWRACGVCGAGERPGWIVDRFGRGERCGECGGKGRFRVDAYTEKRVSAWDAPAPSHTRRVLCDWCGGAGVRGQVRCEPCGGSGRLTVVVDRGADPGRLLTGVALEAALERRAAAGSYVELDRALAALRSDWRTGYRAFMARWVLEVDGPHPFAEDALTFVCELMPERVRVPTDLIDAWRDRGPRAAAAEVVRVERVAGGGSAARRRDRDARVRQMWARVGDTGEVAREFGLSVRRVQEIIYGPGGA